MNASILPEDASNKTVVWSVYGEQPMGVAQITSTGLVSAIAPGTAVLRATSAVDATKFAEFSLTVKAKDKPVDPVGPNVPGVPGVPSGSGGDFPSDGPKVENGTIKMNTKVDGDGLTAKVEVNMEAIEKAWKSTPVDSSGHATIRIEISGEQGKNSTEISIPAEAISILTLSRKSNLSRIAHV